MKNYNEIADSVLSRRDEYIKNQKAKRKKAVVGISVVCSFVIMFFGIGLWQKGVFQADTSSEKIIEVTDAMQGKTNVDIKQNTSSKTEKLSEVTTEGIAENETIVEDFPDGGFSTGVDVGEWWNIPALPFDRNFEVTGEEITDEEAKEYFELNKSRIFSTLSASGEPTDSLKISEKGYCHVNYDGTEGKCFEVRQNYRDYLVYNGNKLVAIITLYKDNGQMYDTLSLGASWFDNYNSFLQNHKGEELVYVYAGWFELIIAPDNIYCNPMNYNTVGYLDGVENPYEIFYHEKAVYVS
ncbi:MAG: hypothetical protein E7536_07095 [Ruminococcaceae bacterium]|nr:hypothetical protein [Oscillospiraceae bacterium]